MDDTTHGPSPHLTWRELACKDGTPYPLEWRESRAAVLAEAFEDLRRLLGGAPLLVLSAYRTPAHNRKIGGARNSQHLEGRALDLRSADGRVNLHEIAHFARTIAAVRGIGVYRTFVHIDVRPQPTLVAWSGTAQKDDRA